MNTLLIDKVITTRVFHKCVWCDEVIPKSSKVRYRSYTWDDGIASEYWHDECWTAMLNADIGDIEEGYLPGDHKRGSTININDL